MIEVRGAEKTIEALFSRMLARVSRGLVYISVFCLVMPTITSLPQLPQFPTPSRTSLET